MNRKYYREVYLNSPHWQKIKEKFRGRGCEKKVGWFSVCGEKPIDVHHKTYERIGNERLSDLIPLCRKHHDQQPHPRKGKEQKKEHWLRLFGFKNLWS